MKMSENVYRKNKNGVYEPFGLSYDYLPDGIWFVRHHEGCTSISNIPHLEGIYRIASKDEFKDIIQLCSLQDYTDYILDSQELRDILNNQKGYTISELVGLCVSLVFKKNQNSKIKHKK